MPRLGLQHSCVVLASGALLVGNADSFRPELREELRRYSYVEAQNLIFEFQQGHDGILLLSRPVNARPTIAARAKHLHPTVLH